MSVITNYFILPHPSLQLFVDSYVLCTSNGKVVTLRSNWPASNETSLVFYMSDYPCHTTTEGGSSSLQSNNGCIIGLLSRNNGFVSFSGVYHTFIIQFKANGFYKLFRMPPAEFINNIFCFDDVFGNKAKNLNEAMRNAVNIEQMAGFADKFLLYFLAMQKSNINSNDGITFVSNELFKNTSLLNIEQYAGKAFMSVRNFARRFNEQVGVSPKLYCRIMRFNNAINTKFKHPQTTWTSIAYDCGYFDQMHMIKDFKEFANFNPSEFLMNNDLTESCASSYEPITK